MSDEGPHANIGNEAIENLGRDLLQPPDMGMADELMANPYSQPTEAEDRARRVEAVNAASLLPNNSVQELLQNAQIVERYLRDGAGEPVEGSDWTEGDESSPDA